MASSNSTVLLRVKRKRTEEPVEAIALTRDSKKRKEEEENKKVLFRLKKKIAGGEVAAASSPARDRKRKTEAADAEKDKEEDGQRKKKRFKVVETAAAIDDETAGGEKVLELVPQDEEEIQCNGETLVREKVAGAGAHAQDQEDYVYDEYLLDGAMAYSDFFADYTPDYLVATEHFLDGDDDMRLKYRDQLDNDADDFGGVNGDDEDSNDENHWMNEYPDSDDYGEKYNNYAYDSDLDLEDRLRLEDDDDSSLEEEEGLVHTRTKKQSGPSVADLHGESYARFKRKILKDLHPEWEDDADED